MKKKNVLYIPLLVLAVFAFSALALHYRNITVIYGGASKTAEFPFTYQAGVLAVTPEAAQAGIKPGDRLEAINGRTLENNDVYWLCLKSLKVKALLRHHLVKFFIINPAFYKETDF